MNIPISIIEEKLKIWNDHIQDKNITFNNKKLANDLFQSFKIGKIYQNIIIPNYFTNLNYAFENKLEAYLLTESFGENLNKTELICKVYFDANTGGIPGLAHGGFLFSILYLSILLYIENSGIFGINKKYSLEKVITTYNKRVQVDSFMIIRVNLDTNNLNNNYKQIIAELFDYNKKISNTMKCKVVSLDKLNKF